MKYFKLLLLTFFIIQMSFGQSISPTEDYPQCPNLNYPNSAGYEYVITFNDNANKFSIGTKTNSEVLFYSTPYNGDTLKASIRVQFEDQSASAHSFQIKKGTSVVKTFTFNPHSFHCRQNA